MSNVKQNYHVIFIVLVYRNTSDLKDFFKSNNVCASKTIVVNSYYDKSSEIEFKNIAKKNDADFINVPNRGYGAGNNVGCNYAIEHYTFDYLIISNADVEICDFNTEIIRKYGNSIIAPCITNKNGKLQNPCAPYKHTKLYAWIKYWLFKGNHNKLMIGLYALSRLKKIFFYNITSRFSKKIFAAHGAFVIIPQSALYELFPLYNEEMFLFNEEAHLAMKARCAGIHTYYVPEITIYHKEDGSMNIASINIFEREKQSFGVYYNEWFKKQIKK